MASCDKIDSKVTAILGQPFTPEVFSLRTYIVVAILGQEGDPLASQRFTIGQHG